MEPVHFFPEHQGIPECSGHVFQGLQFHLGISQGRHRRHIGGDLVIPGHAVLLFIVRRCPVRLRLDPFHFCLRGQLPVGNGRLWMVHRPAYRAGFSFFQLAGQDGGLTEDVVPPDGFRLFQCSIPDDFCLFCLCREPFCFLRRFIGAGREPVHFPLCGAIGFCLRQPLHHDCDILLPLAHFLLPVIQRLPLGRQGIEFFHQAVPFLFGLLSLGAGLFPVSRDFLQVFKVRRQGFGTPDTLQVFLCLLYRFLLGGKFCHLGLRFLQQFVVVCCHRRLLVVFSELPILSLQPFLFFSPFLQKTGGVLYFSGEFLFIGGVDHGKCGGQLRLFCGIGLCQLIHGNPQFILEIGEPLGLEELLQDGFPVLRLRHQEFSEIPLGQQDDLAELLGIEADELARRLFDTCPEGPHFFPILQFRQGCLHGRPCLALAPFLIDELLRAPGGPVGFPADYEIKNNFRLLGRGGIVAPHVASGPIAAGLPVEGVAHGIEDSGLPGPRGPADEEEMTAFQFLEINDRLPRIGAESPHGEFQRLHCAFSFLYTLSQMARDSFSSSSVRSRSRKWWTKSFRISSSLIFSRWIWRFPLSSL